MSWFLLEIDEVFKTLSTSPEGITKAEAERRLEDYGANKLEEGKKKTPIVMFLMQFTDFMIIVLIAAAVVSGIIGDITDTVVILLIVALNAVIGFVQEYRAEKAIEALKSMAAPTAAIKRNGAVMTVRAEEIVPGDAVLLDAGRIVPADLRLFESANLKIEEAALTGESAPVEKRTPRLHDKHLPIGDRRNMAYKGTIVVYGRGAGIAVETGMTTEFGKIAAMLAGEEETKTPLQKRMAKFGRQISMAVIAICAVIFAVGFLRGEDPLFMFLTAISLSVAAIPEALPVVVAISLAMGAKKLVHSNVLIRRLPAVEALGSVTRICSDKTGTLTLNKMTVEEVFVDGKLLAGEGIAAKGNVAKKLFIAMALCNDVTRDAKGKPIGDPTEAALFLSAEKAGFVKSEIEKTNPRVAEIPFDSDRKMMTTFHKDPEGGYISFTKGGVEVVMEKAIEAQNPGGATAKETLLRENERMASDGLRVLAIGMRKWSDLPIDMSPDAVEKELTVLGFAGILDPPREEARDAIKLCKLAGITPIMITGDHPITAKAIARRLGIVEDGGEVMTGPMLDKLTLEEFEEKVERIRVYARVAPAQKLKIVKALQDKGEFVAMTGDGVNDAPALKRADIGVSMGITGTDVAKEASHMILLDDNFASIVGAVRKGRRIYDNIRKFIKYTMTSNTAEIWAILLPPFLGMPIALLPIHILWINLVTDGLPGLALTVEVEEKGVMNRPPRPPQESVFAHGMGVHVIWVGLAMGAVSIFSQALSIRMGLHWQTMVFTVLCLSQMGHVLAIRSERESFFSLGAFSNMPLVGAVLLTFTLQLALIYVPFLQPIFKTEALSFGELMFALALSSVIFTVVEAEKFFKRKFSPGIAVASV
ncbi:MAG: cation-translocating P-type ATPase [Thermodesulfobacteriota bacterium]